MDFTNLKRHSFLSKKKKNEKRHSLKSEIIHLLVILWSIDITCAMHVKFGPRDGPVLCEDGKISPLRLTENVGLSGEIRGEPTLKEADGFEPVRQEEEKESFSVERTQSLRPNRMIK